MNHMPPLESLLARVRGEYREMPGPRLTLAQACRLWQVDAATCQILLGQLVGDSFLCTTDDGAYIARSATSRRQAKVQPGTSSVVLLIEPDDHSRLVYADALRSAGFTVVTVPDCTTGLYAIAEVTPHIVIASFNGRTHDACFALCERLRADSRTQDIPILLTTAGISAKDLERATGLSVLGISIGPHDDAKMISAVRGVLAVAEGHASMSQPEYAVCRAASANE